MPLNLFIYVRAMTSWGTSSTSNGNSSLDGEATLLTDMAFFFFFKRTTCGRYFERRMFVFRLSAGPLQTLYFTYLLRLVILLPNGSYNLYNNLYNIKIRDSI